MRHLYLILLPVIFLGCDKNPSNGNSGGTNEVLETCIVRVDPESPQPPDDEPWSSNQCHDNVSKDQCMDFPYYSSTKSLYFHSYPAGIPITNAYGVIR